MIVALAEIFGGANGAVLEIGSGTGQHAASFALAFPALAWWPSDPDPVHRRSIAAWQAFVAAPERPPFDLDASENWAADPHLSALKPLVGVVSMNVVHIAPFTVAEGIVAGAGKILACGGKLVFYGPFNENRRPTGEGNARFDRGLRAENPEWGIRDIGEVADLANAAGFGPPEVRPMPADNRLLVFTRS